MKRELIFTVAGISCCAAADTVDFNSDPLGAKPNGWVSDDSPNVTFSDTIGANLSVGSYAESNFSPALLTFPDDASRLLMTFASPVSSLTLSFGNDDPSRGDVWAFLRGLSSNVQTGLVSVDANDNDLMDQTITINGSFDQIEFYYARQDGSQIPNGLIEVVDNVQFDLVTIPLPTGAAMAGLGLGLVGVRRRR